MSTPLHTLFGLPESQAPLLFLAPMAGYTNAPMRRICHQHGAALTFTEMVSDLGLLHTSDKTWYLLENLPDEGPVVAHLYGANLSSMAEAAARIERTRRFVGIDVNSGCPVTKVIRSGCGAALIKDPQRIHDILHAMRRSIKIPLTLKTRVGPYPDKIAIFDILAAAESAGANALTLHGRFTSQGHAGTVHLDLIGEVKARAKIPIIGNGGICSPYDAWRMLHETKVDALMIARAAIGNPWIFSDIRTALETATEPDFRPKTSGRIRRDLADIQTIFHQHLRDEQDFVTRVRSKYELPLTSEEIEQTLATTFRCNLFRYFHSLKGSSYLRANLQMIHTLKGIHEAVKGCLEREAAYRAKDPRQQT